MAERFILKVNGAARRPSTMTGTGSGMFRRMLPGAETRDTAPTARAYQRASASLMRLRPKRYA